MTRLVNATIDLAIETAGACVGLLILMLSLVFPSERK